METKEQKELFGSAIKLFGLTLFLLVSLLGEVVLVLPVLAPNSAISLFDGLGMKKAVVATYEMKYQRTGSAQDLYNLVVASSACGDSKRVIKYTNKMLNRKDFDAFAQAFDAYALEHADKDKLYLVASVENYLRGLQVEAKYKKNKKGALDLAAKCFESTKLSSVYAEQFVSIVQQDKKLTNAQKTELLVELAHARVGDKTVIEILDERYSQNLPNNLEDADLLVLQQLWQNKNIEFVLACACGQNTTQIEQQSAELASAISTKIS